MGAGTPVEVKGKIDGIQVVESLERVSRIPRSSANRPTGALRAGGEIVDRAAESGFTANPRCIPAAPYHDEHGY